MSKLRIRCFEVDELEADCPPPGVPIMGRFRASIRGENSNQRGAVHARSEYGRAAAIDRVIENLNAAA